QPGHDRGGVGEEAKLHAQADILVDVAHSVVWFGAKDRPNFIDALKDADHDLLVKLGALGQVGGTAKVVNCKDVCAAFCGGCNQFGRLDLGEARGVEASAESGHDARGQPADSAARGEAIGDDGM